MLRKGLRTLVASAVAAVGAAVAATAVASSGAAPTPFELVLEGSHVPATISTPSGLEHAGTFTASAPACATGRVADVRWNAPAMIRRYICDDGSGTFTARIDTELAEHGDGSGIGSWRIVEGTGAYASSAARGRSPASRRAARSSTSRRSRSARRGPASSHSTPSHRRSSLSRPTFASVKRGTYRVGLALSARDGGNAVSYDVVVTAPNGEPAGDALRHGRVGLGVPAPLAADRRLRGR